MPKWGNYNPILQCKINEIITAKKLHKPRQSAKPAINSKCLLKWIGEGSNGCFNKG